VLADSTQFWFCGATLDRLEANPFSVIRPENPSRARTQMQVRRPSVVSSIPRGPAMLLSSPLLALPTGIPSSWRSSAIRQSGQWRVPSTTGASQYRR
jgi:hypothetical protein